MCYSNQFSGPVYTAMWIPCS